jgi:hypothetical protein
VKQELTVFLVVALIMSAFINLAQANPYQYHESVSPPWDAKPLNISVFSPLNNSLQKENTINITLNINNKGTTMTSIIDAYLKADWIENDTSVYRQNHYSPEFPSSWNYSKVFTDIPEGEHQVIIYATGHGMYITNEKGLTANSYAMKATTVLLLTIDSLPPQVTINSPAVNASYKQSNIPLNFTTNENAMPVTYSFDGGENQTYSQNITLSGLSEGNHNITAYAWDEAGNVGASQITYFSVEFSKPFPTAIVLACVIGTAVIAASLLAYVKHHRLPKRESRQNSQETLRLALSRNILL